MFGEESQIYDDLNDIYFKLKNTSELLELIKNDNSEEVHQNACLLKYSVKKQLSAKLNEKTNAT